MSYSDSFPTQRPSLNLDFANSGKLDSRISYSRSSTGTAFSSERHKSSENLFDKSNVYNSGGWLEVRVDQTIGQTDPTGGTSAKLINQTSGQVNAGVVYYSSTFGTEELTFSIYLKPNGRTKPNLAENLTDSGNTVKRTYFDLTGSGAVGTKDAAHTASIAKFGDWYRCTITFTPHAADSGSVYLYISDTDNSQTVADDGNGYVVYGANLSTTGQLVTNETSGSIHREFAPLLKTSQSDQPRFEYSATDGQSEGLLVEQQSTNLTVASEEVNNWTTDSATVQQNVAISPDGTLTADRLTDDASGPRPHFVYKSTALGVSVGSTVYTVSFYAKASGHSELQTYDNNQNTSANLAVNLANGTITSGTGLIKSCGDGWYRISYQVTADHSTTSVVRILMKSGGSNSYTGNSYSGILLWGMQIEIGSAPTSYIKTTTSATATRSADSCSVAVSEITGFADTEGTLVAEGKFNNPAASSAAATLQDAAHTEYAKITTGSADSVNGYVRASGADQAVANAGSVSGDNAFKVAFRYDENNVGVSLNGGTAVTDTSATMPIGMTTLYIGRSTKTWDVLNGNLKRVAYYAAALSDTELKSLTSS